MSAVLVTLRHAATHPEDANAPDVKTDPDEALACWQWDLTRDIVDWSEPLYRIAGLDPESPLPPFREHGRFYTSDSWHRLVSAVLKVFTTGAPFSIELRMVRPDHSSRRITCSGEAVRDADEQIVKLRGMIEETSQPRVGSLFPGHSMSTHAACVAAVDSLINAHEDELERVSRQLTEDICQRLAFIAIEVQQLDPPPHDFTTEQLIHVHRLWQHVDETLSRVYRLAQELRPSVLDLSVIRFNTSTPASNAPDGLLQMKNPPRENHVSGSIRRQSSPG